MTRRTSLPRFSVVCLAAGVVAHASRATPETSVPPLSTAAAASPVTHDTPAGQPASTSAKPDSEPPSSAPPAELEALIAFGTNLSERGDFGGAESAFRHVLDAPQAVATQTKQALRALAHMYRRQGALTKAAAICERYVKEYSDDEHVPDVLLELGRTLRGLGAHRLALARFYSVINSTLKLPAGDFDRYQALAKTAQFEIAETHFETGDFSTAAKFYGRLALLDLTPEDTARVQFKTARAQRLQGDLAAAIVTLRSFLEQCPADENAPEARYLLAITLQELKRPQEAFAATLELLQTAQSGSADNPKRWAYWQRRTGNQLANHFFEAGDVVNAQAIYAGLLELSADPQWRLPTTYQLALCFERLGQTERARSAYQSIVKLGTAKRQPELEELVRMATWRLDHLTWRERTAKQVSSLFETTTGKQAIAMPGQKTSDHAPVTSPPGT